MTTEFPDGVASASPSPWCRDLRWHMDDMWYEKEMLAVFLSLTSGGFLIPQIKLSWQGLMQIPQYSLQSRSNLAPVLRRHLSQPSIHFTLGFQHPACYALSSSLQWRYFLTLSTYSPPVPPTRLSALSSVPWFFLKAPTQLYVSNVWMLMLCCNQPFIS